MKNRSVVTLSRHAAQIALLLAILVGAGACSREPRWSAEEKDNARHYILSLAASKKAGELISKPDPDQPQFGLSEINKYQRAALGEAELVQDHVLDKAHPELKEHFRGEYQRGLERILDSYQVTHQPGSDPPASGRIDLQAAGVALLKDWTAWLNAHEAEIRMPAQSPSQRDDSAPMPRKST